MTMQAEALDRLIAAVEAGHYETQETACPLFHERGLCCDVDNAYTGSLDAAKALHDALLPGMWFCISGPHSKIGGIYDGGPSRFDALLMRGEMQQADNPARAWLLAVLRAYREALE